jgi:tetratricopeptide (TPR) repeat protein
VAKRPKHKHHGAAVVTLSELKARVERAMSEGRFQTALELAKSLFKQERSPVHQELVQKATLGRARQLRTQGHTRDAAVVLDNATHLSDSPAWLQQVAEEYAACGEPQKALNLLSRVPGAAGQPRVLGQLADAALRQGKAGRNQLPDALKEQFDLILQTFAHAEAGQDDAARAALQGIGLQSPFLEWKLLLRGLLAYYQKDDARAVENWQRLDPERLPARLAAPLRFNLDASYRTAQPPTTQTTLQQQADRLQGSGLVQPLRAVQAAMANEQHLPQAFRLAENLLPALRREAAHLVPRLASCFYWTIIDHGAPEDVGRYRRVFGAPPDDPRLARLEALALDHRGWMPEAHKFWQEFEKSVAANPTAWPGEQAQRVRALVWCHMGHNADSVPDLKGLDDLPPFLRDHPNRPRPLKPAAEECFRQSIQLAPDTLEPYESLFEHYQDKKKPAKAIEAGRRLLERFPEHVKTLEALADLLMEKQEYVEAIGLYERALKANPLERRLRARLSTAHSYNARAFAEADHFDQARAEYQAALAFSESHNDSSVLCKWAACEFKAGAAERAEELLHKAREEAGTRLAVAFSMIIETIRLKLARPLKSRFDKELKEALAEPPTGQAAAAIADTAAAHRLAGVTYYGQKTHEKKVLNYLEKALKGELTEDQLTRLCAGAKILKAPRLLRSIIKEGQNRFPASPFFYLAEAEDNLSEHGRRSSLWETEKLLKKARELVTAMPHDDRQKALLALIEHYEQEMRALNPFASLFGGFGGPQMLDPFFGMGDDYDEFDEFDDEGGPDDF